MKKISIAFLLVVFTTLSFAQTTNNYWVVFKDKKNNSFSIDKPEAYLSERSIARRERQHIAITAKDLPVSIFYIKQLQQKGAVILSRSKWFNAALIQLNDAAALEEIKSLPYVKYVQTIAVNAVSVNEKFKIEEELFEDVTDGVQSQRASGLNYGLGFNQANMIGADCMHNLGYMGQGMVIAEMDAGFYKVDSLPAFDSLRMNNQLFGCRDFVTHIPGDTMVFEDYAHGMNVLSCMVGNLPGRLVGTAPKANFWLLRTEDIATEGLHEEINWLTAAEFADSVGADIITSSLGYSRGFDIVADEHTYADMDGNTTIITKAADWAASIGIFVVTSAGNAGGPSWFKITAPADADSALTVGAVDSLEIITGFSSRGPSFDGRIKPDVVAKGNHATVAAPGGDVMFTGGTSFSCPITAGAVACLWQANPSRTNMELFQAIHFSSDQFVAPDTIKGYGVPDFCNANNILAGINEQMANEEYLSVYPNPFHSTIEVLFNSSKKQNAILELFDISGRRVMSMQLVLDKGNSNRINVEGGAKLASGLYILKLKTEDKVYSKKISKE